MIDYPTILRAAGLQVVERPGWRTRTSPGGWQPRAVMVHHDASREGPSNTDDWIADDAPDAPLAQLWVDYWGRWHVLAHGNCNHAGRGDGWGVVPADQGNVFAIGVEVDFTTGEPLRPTLYQSVVTGVRALADHLDADVHDAVMGHKEYAPGRKTDPDWDMDRFRGDVAAARTTEQEARTVTSGRIAGEDRWATAAAMARTIFAHARHQGGIVWLVRGDTWTSDTIVAGQLPGPCLPVPADGDLPEPIADELAAYRPDRVMAIGGPGAISDGMLEQARRAAAR